MWASLIIGLATAGYGAYQKGKAKKAYNAIGDANYDISQQYYDKVGLAENMAQSGWSQQATNFYTQQLQQGFQSSTSAILNAGGGVNDFSSAYSNFVNGVKSFALEGDKLRQSNIARLMEARTDLAREETQQWAINKYKKVQDQKAAAAQAIKDANATMTQGFNTAIQGVTQVGQYYLSNEAPSGRKSSQDSKGSGKKKDSSGGGEGSSGGTGSGKKTGSIWDDNGNIFDVGYNVPTYIV